MSQIQKGCRIQAITFKLKNLEGIVKFVGQVAGKDGQWVGIELNDEKGDMDGTVNGEILFECKPFHGVLLRPTQVKVLEQPPNYQQEEQIHVSDSPLLDSKPEVQQVQQPTTTAVRPSFAQRAVAGGTPLTSFLNQKPPTTEENDQAESSVAKAQNWKNKVEELRRKKQMQELEKANAAAATAAMENQMASGTTTDSVKEEQKEEIKQMFAPAPGLNKEKDGKILVNQSEALKQPAKFKPLSKLQQDATNVIKAEPEAPQLPVPEQPPVVAPEEKKKLVAPASKIGGTASGLQKPADKQPANPVSKLPIKAPATAASKALDEKNDKLMKLKMDKERRDTTKATSENSGATTKVTPTTNNTQSTTGPVKVPLVKPVAPVKEEAKGTTAPKVGTNAGQSSTALKNKLGVPTETAKASVASKDTEIKPSTGRAMTARGTKDDSKDATIKRVSNPTATKLPGSTVPPSRLTKAPLAKPNQDIQEVDQDGDHDEDLLSDNKPALPVKKSPNQPTQYLEPTEAQILQFMQSTGQGVSQDEHKKVTEELRKKKEEVFSLQHEVKDLSDRIQNIQQQSVTAQELLKTEMEIKTMELEQRLAAAQQMASENLSQEQIEAANLQAAQAAAAAENAAQKVAAGYQQQIATYQAQIEQHQKDRSKMMEETQEMQKTLQAQQDALKEKLLAEIDLLKHRISDSENRYSDLNKLYADSEAEKSKLSEEMETKKEDFEILQLELDKIKDEKEDLLNQMQLMSQESQEDVLAGLSEDELKSQNQKLRQAISNLTLNFEVEKSRFATALAEVTKRARLVDEYEKKLEEMDFLLEEVETKEREKLEMEARLDECLEFEKMVEEMAEEIIRKEDENEELQERIKEIEETLVMQEEITDNLEEQIKDMNEEMANKDARYSELEVEKIRLEEMILDENQMNQKYKERLADFQQQYKVLQEQLQAAYAVGDQKFKITALLDKQNSLLQKVREAGKRESEMVMAKLHLWQGKLRQNVVEAIIPPRLTEQVQLESLERVQMLGLTKGQALVLVRELCERQFSKIASIQEEEADQVHLAKIFLSLADLSILYINLASRITYWLSKMDVAVYVECMQKLHNWSKIGLINNFFEKILSLLKDEARLLQFDRSVFETSVKAMQDLEAQVALKYSDKREGEEDMEKSRKREQEVKLMENGKIRLRNQVLKMCLAVTVIGCPQISSHLYQHTEESSTKCKIVYWKLMNVIFQLDQIDTNSTGNDFLNLQDLGTDTRLENKYSVISHAMWVSPQTTEKRDWFSILEAVERDIASLSNDYKYRKLIVNIEASYAVKPAQQLDDMYTRGWDVSGPWNLIIEGVRRDFEEVELLKEKIVKLQERQQQMAKEYAVLRNERDEQTVIKKTLEARLAEAIVKAEQVPSLIIDIKRMQEKEQVLQQQMDQAKVEIEKMKDKETQLHKKIEEIQIANQAAIQQAVAAASQGTKRGARQHIPPPPAPVVASTPSSGASTVAQTPGHQQRASKPSEFFKQMQSMPSNRGSFAGRGSLVTPSNQSQSISKVDSVELQRQLQYSEDSFNSVIIELQKDRMAMKGNQLMDRLKRLDNGSENMARFIAKQKEKQEVLKNFSREEQSVLESAVGTIEGLKSRVKREMAQVKVIDLTKADISTILPLIPRQEEQKGGSKDEALDSIRLKEKINYMIVKAKDSANDAFNLLFSKESQLHKVKELSDAVTVEIVDEDLTAVHPKTRNFEAIHPAFANHQEKINVGSLRVSGLPHLKKVINLNDTNLRDFKQNLSVFAH